MAKRKPICNCLPGTEDKRAKLIHEHWLKLSGIVSPEQVSWHLYGKKIEVERIFSHPVQYDLSGDKTLKKLLQKHGMDPPENEAGDTRYQQSVQVFVPVKGLPNCQGTVEDFRTLINGNYVYVDKTHTIGYFINHTHNTFLIARPPGFGKTVTLSMLDCFFNQEQQTASDVFDRMFVGPDTQEKHQRKYFVFSLNLFLVMGPPDKFADSLKRRMLAALRKCNKDFYDDSLELDSILPHAIAESHNNLIILLDNFDAPFLKFSSEENFDDQISTAMGLAFEVLKNTGEFKLAIATCVVPHTYSISFAHVDYLICSQFFRCFGFENLEVYLLLQVKNSYKGATFAELEKFISLYGNYYFATYVEEIAQNSPWTVASTEDPNAPNENAAEQNKSCVLCNPAWVMDHLYSKWEAKANRQSLAVKMLTRLVKKNNFISWKFVDLQTRGCVHTEERLIDQNVHPEQSGDITIYSLLCLTGLALHFICGYKFGEPLKRGEHYILQTPNKTALKTLKYQDFDSSLLLSACNSFNSGFDQNKISKIAEGITECLSLTHPTDLQWEANESNYRNIIRTALRHVPTIITETEFISDAGTRVDLLVLPRKDTYDTVYVIELKKPGKDVLRSVQDWSVGHNPSRVFEILKKSAKKGFQQILDHEYTNVKIRIKNSHPTLKYKKMSLISVAFFKKEFVICHATVDPTKEISEVSVRYVTTLPIQTISAEKMNRMMYEAGKS